MDSTSGSATVGRPRISPARDEDAEEDEEEDADSLSRPARRAAATAAREDADAAFDAADDDECSEKLDVADPVRGRRAAAALAGRLPVWSADCARKSDSPTASRCRSRCSATRTRPR